MALQSLLLLEVPNECQDDSTPNKMANTSLLTAPADQNVFWLGVCVILNVFRRNQRGGERDERLPPECGPFLTLTEEERTRLLSFAQVELASLVPSGPSQTAPLSLWLPQQNVARYTELPAIRKLERSDFRQLKTVLKFSTPSSPWAQQLHGWFLSFQKLHALLPMSCF